MIPFLIGLILFGVVITGMAASPAFRNFIFILLFLAGAAIVMIVMNDSKQSAQRAQDQATEARQRVTAQQFALAAFNAGQIKVEGVTLKPASYGLNEYILSGTASNDATIALTDLRFTVTMTDCQGASCRIVGQQDVSANVQIPAGQTRGFSSYAIKFPNLPAVGQNQRSWTYKVSLIN